MRFKVYQLRRRGRRLQWREVLNALWHIGDLRSHYVEYAGARYHAATLAPINALIQESPIPDLYEPVLLGFSPLAFRLRGFERVGRGDSTYSVVQEWHIELP